MGRLPLSALLLIGLAGCASAPPEPAPAPPPLSPKPFLFGSPLLRPTATPITAAVTVPAPAPVAAAKPTPAAPEAAPSPEAAPAPEASAKTEASAEKPTAEKPEAAASAEPEPLELPTRKIATVVPPPWNYRPPVVLPPPPPPQMPEPVTVKSSNVIACEARRTLDGEAQHTRITCRNGSTLRQTVYLHIQASNVAGLPTPEAERNGHLLNPGETRTLVALAVIAQPAQVAFTYSHQPRP